MSENVQDHYASTGLTDRILAAVPYIRGSKTPLRPEQLFAYDQLHGRELLATKDHCAQLAPIATDHVLDVGAGVGGPARYFANATGCRVTGIDLTGAFVDAANELSQLCGLQDKTAFVQGDATALPFNDATFDHAVCFYVGMNLPNKPAVLGEIARVLRPGGRLLWSQVTSGTGAPPYPLPWAMTAQTSQVNGGDALQAMIVGAGLKITSVTDETALHLELAKKMRESGAKPSVQQSELNSVVMGPDFAERRVNYIQGLAQGNIFSLSIEAQKPG